MEDALVVQQHNAHTVRSLPVVSVSFIFVSPEVKILVVAATAALLRMTARPPASVLYRFMGLTSRSGKRPFEFSDDVACG